MRADCRDTGCSDDEECRQETLQGSEQHVCVCRDGFERDTATGQCQVTAKSGQCVGHYMECYG